VYVETLLAQSFLPLCNRRDLDKLYCKISVSGFVDIMCSTYGVVMSDSKEHDIFHNSPQALNAQTKVRNFGVTF